MKWHRGLVNFFLSGVKGGNRSGQDLRIAIRLDQINFTLIKPDQGLGLPLIKKRGCETPRRSRRFRVMITSDPLRLSILPAFTAMPLNKPRCLRPERRTIARFRSAWPASSAARTTMATSRAAPTSSGDRRGSSRRVTSTASATRRGGTSRSAGTRTSERTLCT